MPHPLHTYASMCDDPSVKFSRQGAVMKVPMAFYVKALRYVCSLPEGTHPLPKVSDVPMFIDCLGIMQAYHDDTECGFDLYIEPSGDGNSKAIPGKDYLPATFKKIIR